MVRAAAKELLTIRLDDALRLCLLIRDHDPEKYEQAALALGGTVRSRGADGDAR